jgi:hypothetical protein
MCIVCKSSTSGRRKRKREEMIDGKYSFSEGDARAYTTEIWYVCNEKVQMWKRVECNMKKVERDFTTRRTKREGREREAKTHCINLYPLSLSADSLCLKKNSTQNTNTHTTTHQVAIMISPPFSSPRKGERDRHRHIHTHNAQHNTERESRTTLSSRFPLLPFGMTERES